MKANLRLLLLVLTCLLVSSTVAFGETTVKSMVKEHNFKVGPDVRYFEYVEDEADIEIAGYMYGISGEYAYHGISKENNYLMANIDFELLGGSLDYDGQTWGGEPISEDTKDLIIQLRGLIGFDMLLFKNQLITPFVGIGYRYWYDDIGGAGGYEREIQYMYSPVGIKTLHPLSDKWKMGLSAEYDIFLGGRVKSYLSNVNSDYNDPDVEQGFGDGYGLRASAYIKKLIKKGLSISIEPYIRYWKVDQSARADLTFNGNKIGEVYEPENEATSYGLHINFIF